MDNEAISARGNAVVATERAQAAGGNAAVGVMLAGDHVGDLHVTINTGTSSKKTSSSKVCEK